MTSGTLGLVLAVAATILLVLGFTRFGWYNAGESLTVGRLSSRASAQSASLAKMFFSWLGWLLVAATVICAVASNLPIGRRLRALRLVTPILGILAMALTVFAVLNLFPGHALFRDSQPGLFMALGGFLIAAAAGALAPRPIRTALPRRPMRGGPPPRGPRPGRPPRRMGPPPPGARPRGPRQFPPDEFDEYGPDDFDRYGPPPRRPRPDAYGPDEFDQYGPPQRDPRRPVPGPFEPEEYRPMRPRR